jgi:hypothetical protein
MLNLHGFNPEKVNNSLNRLSKKEKPDCIKQSGFFGAQNKTRTCTP